MPPKIDASDPDVVHAHEEHHQQQHEEQHVRHRRHDRHGSVEEERCDCPPVSGGGAAVLEKRLLGTAYDNKPLLTRLNWLHVPLLVATPILAIYGLATCQWYFKTWILAAVFYLVSGFGITAGYHRLWSHKAFEASLPARILLMLAGTAAVEGSIRWWCRDHRAHHKYSDTEKDPYGIQQGFWYAHIGWMLVKQDKHKIGRSDISDLNADPIIRWQHRNYLWLAALTSFVAPCLIAGLVWGDYRGGFFIAGVARLVVVHHATFCVNSLAHYLGEQGYSTAQSARNSLVTALLTFGEGYHNFHHEFPSDYRNGIRFYHYDPTKWLIAGLALLGQATGLKRFSDNEVRKAELQMKHEELRKRMQRLDWGPKVADLPQLTWAQVREAKERGEKLLVLDGFVLDVAEFMESHPGGPGILKSRLGRDCSDDFRGSVYRHTNAAHNLQKTMRVARLVDQEE